MTGLGASAQAQLLPDQSLGAETSVVLPNAQLERGVSDRPLTVIKGGATRGRNLFHSFQEFNVITGEQVYFANPIGIDNILSRVTGHNASWIDGILGVDGLANLILLNPNQITFGPNARLDIRGSFTATTAESLPFADGRTWNTLPTENELLSFSTPLGVQFNHLPRGDVFNQGQLAVGAGQTLTLFGHEVVNPGDLATPGGTVQILGNQIGLVDQASIDVSSPTGGGTVLIGGAYRGQGETPTAQNTRVDNGVQIDANALDQGDGGQVIVWADGVTDFAGQIEAMGGPQGGQGGLVETSGKQTLRVVPGAWVNASAPQGLNGLWLLDPSDITVDAAMVASLEGSLAAGTNVELTTVGGDGGSGDINLVEPINASATNDATLTLTASRSILPEPEITISIANGNLILNLNQEIEPTEPTLNSALSAIGTVSGNTTVNLGAGTYQEGREIVLNRNLTLNGMGADKTILDGNNAHRVIKVSDPEVSTANVNINELTVRQGNVEGRGGGIQVEGAGNFVLNNSAVIENNASEVGGGIGILRSGNVTIRNSTIANNTSTSNGAGIDINGTASPIIIENSTISNNVSDNSGGGFSLGDGAQLTLRQSTVTGNRASKNAGGISNVYSGGTVNLSNSILAGNIRDDVSEERGTNISGPLNEQGRNTIPIDIAIDPLLGPLADNGGTTQTHALLGGSPAIDAAGDGAIATDQRGVAAAGPRDIGAYEARFVLTVAPDSNQAIGVEEAASPLTITVTDEVTGNPIDGATLTFQSPASTSASVILSAESAQSGIGSEPGVATVDAVANGFLGDYQIDVDTPGSVNSTTFSLSNILPDSLTLVVDTTSDLDDNNVGVGQFSLREALRLVSANGTIGFAESLGGEAINVDSALPSIDQNLTLTGLNDRPTIASSSTSSLLDITSGATDITINDLILLGDINWTAPGTDIAFNSSNAQFDSVAFNGSNLEVNGGINQFEFLSLNGNNIQLAGNHQVAQNLNLVATGTITQTEGSLQVGGETIVQSTLANAGDVNITHNGNLLLGDTQVGGDLEIAAPDVLRVGSVQVAGTTQFNNSPIDINTTVEETDGTYFVAGVGDVDLSRLRGLPSNIDGNLEVNVGATTGAFTTNFSGTSAIALDQPSNQFSGRVSLLTDLPPTTGAPPSITQSEALNVTGAVRLNAQSAGTITLENRDNQFGSLEITANAASIRENSLASLGESNIQTDLTVTAQDVEIDPGLFVNGNLILQPIQNDQAIALDSGPSVNADSEGFRIDVTDIEHINAATPNQVIIGRSDGAGTLNWSVDANDPFAPPLILRSPEGAVNITAVPSDQPDQPLTLSDLTVTAEMISLLNSGDITLSDTQLLGAQSAGTLIEINTGLSPVQLRRLNLEGPGLIEAPLGFINIFADTIEATNAENHDIVAGAVNIQSTFAQTLQNIALQNARTPNNDIISTGLAQNTSGLDPSQGVNELPTNFSDAAGQIAAGCRANAGAEGQSEFVITGRGGLPKRPGDPLSAEVESVPWVTVPGHLSNSEPDSSSASTVNPTVVGRTTFRESSTPRSLREAQGWAKRADGQIFFVATSSTTVKPHVSGLPDASLCSASSKAR